VIVTGIFFLFFYEEKKKKREGQNKTAYRYVENVDDIDHGRVLYLGR